MEVMEQRRIEIVDYINELENVTFAQLKQRFPNVSDMTLRTDLKYLDEQKQIIRIHGGAKSIQQVVGNDDYLNKRFSQNIEQKKVIAHKGASLIEEHQCIFLDSGSTTTMLAKCLKDQQNRIFTCGLSCAIEMAHLKQPFVNIIGGTLNSRSLSIHGSQGIRELQNIYFDIAFIGVTKYSTTHGFTCESFEDALLKKTAIERARKVIILMDSSKINKEGTYTICHLNEIDGIICDNQLPQTFQKECEEFDITIY